MDNIPFDSYDRTELAQFLGKEVSFEGQVFNTTSPTKDKSYICLRNVKIALRDDEVIFDERPFITCHHIWLETSEITHMKTRLTDVVMGSCTVFAYTRKDGSSSYCLRFQERGLTDSRLLQEFVNRLDMIAHGSDDMTLAEQHESINGLLQATVDFADSGKVYYHFHTRSEFLNELRKRRRGCMLRAGVVLPPNRSGRRMRREGMKSRHRKALPQANGFS